MAFDTNGRLKKQSGLFATKTPRGYTAHTEFGVTSRQITPQTFMRKFNKQAMTVFKSREVLMLPANEVGLKWYEQGKDITSLIFNGHKRRYKEFFILVSKEK